MAKWCARRLRSHANGCGHRTPGPRPSVCQRFTTVRGGGRQRSRVKSDPLHGDGTDRPGTGEHMKHLSRVVVATGLMVGTVCAASSATFAGVKDQCKVT